MSYEGRTAVARAGIEALMGALHPGDREDMIRWFVSVYGDNPMWAPRPELGRDELELLRLAARGLSNPEMAAATFSERRSVARKLERIRSKFGAESVTDAIVRAVRMGVL